MTKKKLHQARKGVGCSHEYYMGDGDGEEEEPLLCGYAEHAFGGYRSCTAPGECYMDIKITVPYDHHKHCTNCSEPNKPFEVERVTHNRTKCPKCGCGATYCGDGPKSLDKANVKWKGGCS